MTEIILAALLIELAIFHALALLRLAPRAKGGHGEAAEDEYEKKWQEAVNGLLAYDMERARKAVSDDEDE